MCAYVSLWIWSWNSGDINYEEALESLNGKATAIACRPVPTTRNHRFSWYILSAWLLRFPHRRAVFSLSGYLLLRDVTPTRSEVYSSYTINLTLILIRSYYLLVWVYVCIRVCYTCHWALLPQIVNIELHFVMVWSKKRPTSVSWKAGNGVKSNVSAYKNEKHWYNGWRGKEREALSKANQVTNEGVRWH